MATTWQRTRPGLTIIGVDTRETLDAALASGAIDKASLSIPDAVSSADLTIVSTPLSAIPDVLKTVGANAKPGSIVTDTGSVKQPIVELAQELIPDGVRFVGGHPMAGSEHSGFGAADDFLFENAVYVLCPDKRSDVQTLERSPLVDLIRSLGARIMVMDPSEHDKVAAGISHLPQLLSVALVNSANLKNDDIARNLAAGGFRDMTRIASSPYHMWKEIIAANHGPILDKLAVFSAQLQQFRNRIIEEDYDALAAYFEDAESSRALVSTSTKGFLAPLADLLVRVHDRPGELKRITGILSDNDINIKDLELLKLREGTGGTFRISFENDNEISRAASLLAGEGYETRKP